MDYKSIGRKAAFEMTEKVGIPVTFIEFDGKRYHFSTQWYRLYKVIGLDGSTERESKLSKTWARGNEYAYFITACYPEQITNGDLEFMLENRMTQEEHERWEN